MTVERLLRLGARPLELGDSPAVVLADPEGNPFSVMPSREQDAACGPLGSLSLDSAEPLRDAAFWSWLTGWPADGTTLRHPSGRGPALSLRAEPGEKAATKNRWHLDVRLAPDEDADVVAAAVASRGGRELHPRWGDLPWRVFADPSGNEFCVLRATPHGGDDG